MPLAEPPAPPPLVWLAQPSPEQVKAAADVFGDGDRPGKGAMTCYVLSDGRLESCRVDERVTTPGLVRGLPTLAPAYRLDVKASGAPAFATVSVAAPKSYDVAPRVLAEPTVAERAAVPTSEDDDGLSLSCKVTVAGSLADCGVITDKDKPAAATVAAALLLVARYRFTPAFLSGRPVDSYARIPLTSHVVTHPDWLQRPSGDDLARYYPAVALNSGLGGVARMQCRVVTDGTLDACQILSEDPPGIGFGDALLKMSSKFRMKPKTVDGRPETAAVVVFPVIFKAPGARKVQPDEPGSFKIIPWMAWTQAPTPAAVTAAFPASAREAGVFGHAAIRCNLTRAGTLKDCEDTEESPERMGFRKAALSLAPQFRTDVSNVPPKQLFNVKVALSFDFSSRALRSAGERYVRRPQWIESDPPQPQAPFPKAAVAAGVLSGVGVVDCRIGDDGRLVACLTEREEPAGLGFGEAAVKTASTMRANLWTLDGEAAAGQKVRLPLRFIDGAASEKAAQDTAPKPDAKGPTG